HGNVHYCFGSIASVDTDDGVPAGLNACPRPELNGQAVAVKGDALPWTRGVQAYLSECHRKLDDDAVSLAGFPDEASCLRSVTQNFRAEDESRRAGWQLRPERRFPQLFAVHPDR